MLLLCNLKLGIILSRLYLNSSAAGSASKFHCLEDNKSQNVNVLSMYRFFRTSRKYV